jgi:hypothetical protein
VTARRTYALWAATRLALLVLLYLPRVGGHTLFGDLGHYKAWGDGFVHWTRVPYRDFGWEYPPGALLVIGPPGLVMAAYSGIFIALMIVADLGVVVALRRLGARLGSNHGLWLWLGSVLLLGPIAYTRYDTVSSLLAVLALLGIAAGMPLAAGLALGGGIAMKLWPALLLLVVPFAAQRRKVLLGTGAVLAASVLVVLAMGGARHGAETFSRHTGRGLQVESIAATPLVIAERGGADISIDLHQSSGSWDLTGTGVATALTTTSVLSALALVVIGAMFLWVRRRPELWLDLPAAALLVLTVTDKVLSPQYQLWLLGLLAAALCRRGSALVPAAVLVALSVPLTQVVYPVYYRDLVHGHGLVVVVVLALRNALLVAATIVAVVRLWLAGRTATP